MTVANQRGAEASQELTPEQKEEVRLARRCFAQVERLTTLMAAYPAGHPTVEGAVGALHEVFYQFFEVTDRLTVQVHPHWMNLYGSGQVVWETNDPKDYCFALNRDGIYLIHILAGVDGEELQRFVEILNALVNPSNLDVDAVTRLFEGSFRYVSWDAIDESLAALAGVDSDMRNRDTREEQEMIDDLFEDAFDKQLQEKVDVGDAFETDFEVRLGKQAGRQMKLEVGSREFLELSEEAQEHLKELKLGFTAHNELEHRQGEVLSALLGARPKRKLRQGAVRQIGNVMGTLLETSEPWEALSFLKLIHHWRDKFHADVAGELKEVVRECFTEQRIQELSRQCAKAERGPRRAILQMFHALHLQEASTELAEQLGWDISDESRDDIVRYLRQQARGDKSFIEGVIARLPGDRVSPLVELLIEGMPRSRGSLVNVLALEVEPTVKVQALRALRGTWEDATEIRDRLLPLVKASHSPLRRTAAESLAEAAPHHVYRVLEPMFTSELAKRPEDEVQELVRIFVDAAGEKAIAKLKELVQRRGIASEDEQELAITVVKALIKAPTREVIELLEGVAGDWLVAGRIRSTCKEVVELLK